MRDLSERTLGTYQITSDALRGYVGAIEEWFGADVHFAQLQKIYGRTEAGPEWYGGGSRVSAAVPKLITKGPVYTDDYARGFGKHTEIAGAKHSVGRPFRFRFISVLDKVVERFGGGPQLQTSEPRDISQPHRRISILEPGNKVLL